MTDIAAALVENRRWLLGYAMRLVRDENAAEDLVQDACVTAMTTSNRPTGNVRSWLYGHVKNAWRDSAKRLVKHASVPITETNTTDHLADGAQEYATDLAALSRKVDAMPALHRDTFRLVEMDGYGQQELATMQGVARSTISMRIKKVRAIALAA